MPCTRPRLLCFVFGTSVAVKVLTNMAGMSEKRKSLEYKQFVAEQKLLQSVIHPNICRLLGVSADGPQRCLVLEMCPGIVTPLHYTFLFECE